MIYGNDALRSNINQSKNSTKKQNLYQPNIKMFQSPSQQYQNLMYNNNNINFINYNIKVNKIKNPAKEKVIEGDLNFNDKKVHHNKIPNNTKYKKNRNKPTKSPVPVPKDYKPSNFQYKKLLHNNLYVQNSNMLKPKSAYPRKNNFMNNPHNSNSNSNSNSNLYNVNNINKNVVKPNFGGINANFPSNKTYNAFNVFKKNLERTHSPLLRTSGTNNGIHFVQKGTVKSRYISKSPILSKGSIFNRYKMYGFNGASNSTSSSSISNNQKSKKKTPVKNSNQKKNNIQKQNLNNYNVNINNINSLRGKGQTFISGEIVQDSLNNGKFNINNMNRLNNANINNMANLKPVYNPQNLKIESNNALLNIHAEPNKDREREREREREKEIQRKNKEIIEKNIISNISNNISNISNVSNVSNVSNNKDRDRDRDRDRERDISDNSTNNINNSHSNSNIIQFSNNKINDIKKEDSHKANQRSLSQGIVDPLTKNSKEKEREIKEKEMLKNKKEKEIPPVKENKKVIKKIKDILPYTHVGFDGEEPKENNQDNYFIYKNFMNKKDYIYMSVCDGHGVEGHFVSDFIKETLPYDMSENLKNQNILSENEKEKEIIHQIIKETFIMANEKLVDNEDINSLFSGSTCVSLIYTPEKLIVPNIGDSRAVLGRLVNKEKNEYKAIELSRDHKPTEKDEAQRIIENDGRIQPFTEEGEFVGPERVWIKEEEVPGLAMTRSFGDRVAATVGVMSEPEIKEFNFDEGDKFMIIASDGIWEFISSQECINIIKDFYDKNDLKGCCEYLYQESSKRWLKEEEVIDDTTLILVFFE